MPTTWIDWLTTTLWTLFVLGLCVLGSQRMRATAHPSAPACARTTPTTH